MGKVRICLQCVGAIEDKRFRSCLCQSCFDGILKAKIEGEDLKDGK